MANIVSSAYTASAQADGRQQVHEVHTDLVGLTHTVDYLAGAQDNLAANMAVHATNLGNDLANAEVAANFAMVSTQGKNATPVTIYSTVAQQVANLVALWPTLLNDQAIFVGEYMNTLSLATLESVFGWTPTQAQQASTNYLIPYATLAQSIRTAQGGLF
jgi:hypothetical protein